MAKSYKSPSVETVGGGSVQGELGVYYVSENIIYHTNAWWNTYFIYDHTVYMYWENVWLFDANKNIILYLEPV